MLTPTESNKIYNKFIAFIIEQFPLMFKEIKNIAFKELNIKFNIEEIKKAQKNIVKALINKLKYNLPENLESTPFISAKKRIKQEKEKLITSINGFFEREIIIASITDKERLWIIKGIIMTRAVDNSMKRLFMSGEIKYNNENFQGKGFRSLGQEAIYASALRLKRGNKYFKNNKWIGDIATPLIRDLGVQLAFTENNIELAINAQIGKSGKPLSGKDLHYGDFSQGVLPAAAPLAISTCTATGIALAIQLKKESRIALNFIGEGGSSLGEWHEAINFASVKKLPIIFCIENNQTALSTPTEMQSSTRIFGEKASGYGIAHISFDGTDPEEIAAAYTWAANRGRNGLGPTLIELISMRMCGHAHHDDGLYLGNEPKINFTYPKIQLNGYVNNEKYIKWSKKDPIICYSNKLINLEICNKKQINFFKEEAISLCEEAVNNIKKRCWPKANNFTRAIFSEKSYQNQISWLKASKICKKPKLEISAPFLKNKSTYLEGICEGIKQSMYNYNECFLLGEDIAKPYGNVFMLLKSIIEQFGTRIINSTLAENAIIGACTGAALEGMRPIGEIQFNDFIASGFNQLVNNTAKLYYRTGLKIPMVLRMPYGGLRRAGPYHSQDTSSWFYRTPGLKIVTPSTPYDAKELMIAAVNDNNPVLFFEHIALYRNPNIKQSLKFSSNSKLGKAAFRKIGNDLSIISYGAYVHKALECAEILKKEDGINCDILDLRTLIPLDKEAICSTVKKTSRVLLIGEDTKTGSILESIASQIGEWLFANLDAPVKVLGALDTPIPYAPSLEDDFLLQNEKILLEARELIKW